MVWRSWSGGLADSEGRRKGEQVQDGANLDKRKHYIIQVIVIHKYDEVQEDILLAPQAHRLAQHNLITALKDCKNAISKKIFVCARNGPRCPAAEVGLGLCKSVHEPDSLVWS